MIRVHWPDGRIHEFPTAVEILRASPYARMVDLYDGTDNPEHRSGRIVAQVPVTCLIEMVR